MIVSAGFLWCQVANGIEPQSDMNDVEQHSDPRSKKEMLIKLGEGASAAGQYQVAINSFEKAFTISQKLKHEDDMVFLASQIGNAYDAMGDLPNALSWYAKTLSLAEPQRHHKNISHIHNNLGNIYLKLESYAKSLDHYQKALEIKERLQDQPGIANALMNLSIYYLKTKNYQKTLEYQLRALDIRTKIKDPNLLAATYNSIGISYRHLQDYPKALDYVQKAIDIYSKTGNQGKLASTYNNLGVIYLFMDDPLKAKSYYQRSYELKKGSADSQSLITSLNNLADISLKLKQYKQAGYYLDLAEPMIAKNHISELNRYYYKLRSAYYEATQNPSKALGFFKLYHALSDSLASEAKSKQMSELEVKYEVREKENDIRRLHKSNELNRKNLKKSSQLRRALILIIILTLSVALVLIWRYYSIVRLNQKLNESRQSLNRLNNDLEKRVEQEVSIRHEQEQRALRQSRLAILGELAAGIAHELNQPMQTLSFTLENILLAISDKSIDAKYLEQKIAFLFDDISRMQSVIEHIRGFSRQSDDESSCFEVCEAIENAIRMIRERFAKHGIKLLFHRLEHPLLVAGNMFKFEQVILNLLTNARDAVLDRDKSDDDEPYNIEVLVKQEHTMIGILIRDRGCGIAPDIYPKVFDIFFTTKSLERGTGLGLSISMGIIKGMNGSLSLAPNTDGGTDAKILLPVYSEEKELCP